MRVAHPAAEKKSSSRSPSKITCYYQNTSRAAKATTGNTSSDKGAEMAHSSCTDGIAIKWERKICMLLKRRTKGLGIGGCATIPYNVRPAGSQEQRMGTAGDGDEANVNVR